MKPHIYFKLGLWWCESDKFRVWGHQPTHAYRTWLHRLNQSRLLYGEPL